MPPSLRLALLGLAPWRHDADGDRTLPSRLGGDDSVPRGIQLLPRRFVFEDEPRLPRRTLLCSNATREGDADERKVKSWAEAQTVLELQDASTSGCVRERGAMGAGTWIDTARQRQGRFGLAGRGRTLLDVTESRNPYRISEPTNSLGSLAGEMAEGSGERTGGLQRAWDQLVSHSNRHQTDTDSPHAMFILHAATARASTSQ
jgi:hypothetical protein